MCACKWITIAVCGDRIREICNTTIIIIIRIIIIRIGQPASQPNSSGRGHQVSDEVKGHKWRASEGAGNYMYRWFVQVWDEAFYCYLFINSHRRPSKERPKDEWEKG